MAQERGTSVMRPFFDTFFDPFATGAGLRIPETDVRETGNDIQVRMDLPGIRPEDINVELENNVLTISGEKREQREENEEEGRFHLAERRWGQFARSFVLPREVMADRISADYNNGVLTVSIPKSEKARPRRIDVSRRDQGSQQIGEHSSKRG